MSNLSPSTLALLRAAKHDAPSKESRAAIWGGVTSGLVTHTPLHLTPQASGSGAGAPGASGGASVAPQAAATVKGGALVGASLTGMKGAFIGALFGSAISIGVAAFMLRAKPVDVPHAPLPAQVSTQIGNASSANGSNSISTSTNDTNAKPTTTVQDIDAVLPSTTASQKSESSQNTGTSAIAPASNKSSTNNARSMSNDAQSLHSKKSATSTDQNLSPDEALARESALVVEARRDLKNSDAAAALKTVLVARSLEARQMEPEEMKVEAQALRALGRDTEAEKVESQRRTMYPNAL